MKKKIYILLLLYSIVTSMPYDLLGMDICTEENDSISGKKRNREDDNENSSSKKNRNIFIDKNRLDNNALTEGFGYKASNLIELNSFCENYNCRENLKYKVNVPDFFAIASKNLLELLTKTGFSIVERWQAVVAQQQEGKHDAFSVNFLKAREAFEKDLAQALDILSFDNSSISEQINNFIETAVSNNAVLMVRSTGKEDSDSIANAGGNESVANVQPSSQAIMQAIKQVVLSYFSLKSLTQRLVLGDVSVFSAEVFIPVLLQQMIKEEDGDKHLLVSGVMFTQDPECGQDVCGATKIEAVYGYGEGVVNGLVAADTFYGIDLPNGSVATYPVVRKKSERRASVEAGKLGTVLNDRIAAATPTLSAAIVQELHQLGRLLQRYYGYPLDIEFVVKNNEIFIVQARPIVYKKVEKKASYIKDGVLLKCIKGTSIGIAGGFVREINECKEILFCSTLCDALRKYLAPSFDRGALKAVVVSAMAPSMSHEATTFRSLAIPVVCISDFGIVQDALQNGKKLLVDPQQGQLVIVEQDNYRDFIEEGWAGYPAPRLLSCAESYFEVQGDNFNQIARISNKHLSCAEFLAGLKYASRDQTIALITQFQAELVNLGKNVTDEDLRRTYTKLLKAAHVLCGHIVASTEKDDFIMQRLLAIRMLEALVYQQDQAIMLQNSVATVQKIVREENKISTIIPKDIPESARGLFVQLYKICGMIGNEQQRDKWANFIGQAAYNTQQLKQLVWLTKELAVLDILPIWVQTLAAHDLSSKNISFDALINQWVDDFNQDKSYLEKIQQQMDKLKQLPISAFANAERSLLVWEKLQESLRYFMSSDFSAFRADNQGNKRDFARLAAVQALRSFIDVYDCSLKGVVEQKNAALFQDMLQKNLAFLESLVNLLTPEEGKFLYAVESCSIKKHTKTEYFSMMHKLVDKNFTQNDFLPTQGVDLAIFAMGCGHDFVQARKGSNKQPASLADGFSIIHQSLLNYCGVLVVGDANKLVRPDSLVQVEQVVTALSYQRNQPKIVGFEATAQGLKLSYNFPLNNHSCQIELMYINKTKEILLRMHFCGGFEAEQIRWCKGAAFIACLEVGDSLGLVKSHLEHLSTHELIISFCVEQVTNDSLDSIRMYMNNLIRIAGSYTITQCYSFDSEIIQQCKVDDSLERIIATLLRFEEIGCFALFIVTSLLEQESNLDKISDYTLISDIEFNSLGKFFSQHSKFFDTIARIVEKAVKNSKSDIRSFGWKMLEALIDTDDKFQVLAENIVTELAEDKSIILNDINCSICVKLVNKGRALDTIGRIATTAVNNNKAYREPYYGWKIIEALIDTKNDQVCSFIEKIVAKLLEDEAFYFSEDNYTAYVKFISQSKNVAIITKIVKLVVNNIALKDSYFQVDFLSKLVRAITNKGNEGINSLDNIVTELAQNDSLALSDCNKEIYLICINNAVALDSIALIAAKAFKSNNNHIQNFGVEILDVFIDKNDQDRLENIIAQLANDTNITLNYRRYEQYLKFIDLGIALDAIALIAKNVNQNNEYFAQEMIKALIKKDSRFSELLEV